MPNVPKAHISNLTPSRVLRIYGMRRSGNHAVINWLQRNATGGGSVFLNNCHPRKDPVASHRSVEVFAQGVEIQVPKSAGFDARVAQAGPEPVLFVSYEDKMPPAQDAPFAPLFATVQENVVVIYRSFLNWAASLLRKILTNDGYGAIARARVLSAAMGTYAEGLQRVAQANARGFVAICYDRWHASATYRADLLARLGFAVSDNTRGAVQLYGGGSSFQGNAANAEALETDQRAAQMADHPEYQALLWIAARDEGFVATLAQHFPMDAERLKELAKTARLSIQLPEGTPA